MLCPEDEAWAGLATAVALLTRRTMPDVSRDEVLGGQPVAPVLAAMEVITGVLLDARIPADHGAWLLEGLGLIAAKRAACVARDPG